MRLLLRRQNTHLVCYSDNRQSKIFGLTIAWESGQLLRAYEQVVTVCWTDVKGGLKGDDESWRFGKV